MVETWLAAVASLLYHGCYQAIGCIVTYSLRLVKEMLNSGWEMINLTEWLIFVT